jgi:hypothetical protein
VLAVQEAFVKSVLLLPAEDREQRLGYPWELPAIVALSAGMALNRLVLSFDG